MNVLFEIFQLCEPDWTDDFDKALLSMGMCIVAVLVAGILFHAHSMASRHCNCQEVKDHFTQYGSV